MRPLAARTRVVTVIVRPPQRRRRGLDREYLRRELDSALSLGARRIETVVLASNTEGLAFASAHGFVEHDRCVLPGRSVAFVDLHLPAPLTGTETAADGLSKHRRS